MDFYSAVKLDIQSLNASLTEKHTVELIELQLRFQRKPRIKSNHCPFASVESSFKLSVGPSVAGW